MKLTKEERFDRIATIIQLANKEAGEGVRIRDVFDKIEQEDLWKIWWLCIQPRNYNFNNKSDVKYGAVV